MFQNFHKKFNKKDLPGGQVFEILDSGNAGSLSCFGNSLSNSRTYALVESGGDDVILVELFVGDQISQCLSSSHLHFFVNISGAYIESAA